MSIRLNINLNMFCIMRGCDSGFGHNLAQRLDKKGMTVYAGCLFPSGDGAAQLKKSCSNRLKILQLNVTKEHHVQDAVKTVTSTLGDKSKCSHQCHQWLMKLEG